LQVASFALALGFNISGTPSANVVVNPFASELAGLLFIKGLNYIKEFPTQLLSQIESIVTDAAKQIPASGPTPAKPSPIRQLQFLQRLLSLKTKIFFFIFLFFGI
jgi:hypothetical protein